MLDFMRKHRAWIALFGLCIASFLGCIDFTIVKTSLPSIQAEFQIPMNLLQWVTTGFLLSLSVCMIIVGRLADQHGRKKLLMIGLVLFGLASLGAGLSTHLGELIACRVVQGIGVAILYTVPIALISDLFAPELRNKATGIIVGMNGIGLAAGPVIGGIILSMASWHWVFIINVPFVILSAVISYGMIEAKPSDVAEKPSDWLGFVLIMLSFPLFIYALVNGSVLGWGSSEIIIMFVAAIGLLAVFVWHELRTSTPMVNLRLLAQREFVLGSFGFAVLAFYYSSIFLIIPWVLHRVFHDGGLAMGLTLLPATLAVALLSPWVGKRVNKVGAIRFIGMGLGCFVVAAVGLWLALYGQERIWIMLPLMVMGFGWAMILSPSIILAISSLPEKDAGLAMGVVGSLHNLGGCIGMAIASVLMGLVHALSFNASAVHVVEGGQIVLIGLAILSGISLCAMFYGHLQGGKSCGIKPCV